jgi:glycosyltransferase involved in cell wall biosynthesis
MSKSGDLSNYKIALVHDELTRRGGAERVFETMLRLLPNADVYTLYAGRPHITLDGRTRPIKTTFLQRLPVWWRRHPRRLLPLLPYAAEQIDLAEYDLVVSSSSGFAKGIVTRANVPHVCYCHTPTRYVWDARHSVLSQAHFIAKLPGMALLHWLRLTDYAAAQRVDYWLANSEWTRERIATYYRQKSTVLYPPIDTAFFTPSPRRGKRDYFLCVGRLTPSKNFDQAISVCEKLKLPLIIVGEGQQSKALRGMAQRYTTFAGRVDQAQLRDYYRGARALLQPAEEDFGMASAEALACGTPVIAYDKGGVAEIVRHNSTGFLYRQDTVEALAEAIRQFLLREGGFSSEICQHSVMKFNASRFETEFLDALQNVVAARRASR